jgi:glycine/D-amino acid oxidase-like deaminating enzyme
VGVSVALHLQRRGRDVALIDRRDPGEETSYGNAGLIQREAVIPYTFPREFGVVLSYAMNNRRDAVYHLSALPRIAPWLFQYWRNATPERVERSMRALAALMAQCVKEHDVLIAEVGSAAQSLVNHKGWLNCCRTEKTLLKGIADAHRLEEYGVDYAVLAGAQLRSNRICRRHSRERSISAPRRPRPIRACSRRHMPISSPIGADASSRAMRVNSTRTPRVGAWLPTRAQSRPAKW